MSYVSGGAAATVSVPNHLQQVTVDGVVRRFDGELSGSMQAGTVHVDGYADGPLSALLRPGGHNATVMSDCQFDVGPLNSA